MTGMEAFRFRNDLEANVARQMVADVNAPYRAFYASKYNDVMLAALCVLYQANAITDEEYDVCFKQIGDETEAMRRVAEGRTA